MCVCVSGAVKMAQWLRAMWLLMQRAHVQFPKPTPMPSIACNSSFRESCALLWPLWVLYACGHVHTNKHTLISMIQNKQICSY